MSKFKVFYRFYYSPKSSDALNLIFKVQKMRNSVICRRKGKKSCSKLHFSSESQVFLALTPFHPSNFFASKCSFDGKEEKLKFKKKNFRCLLFIEKRGEKKINILKEKVDFDIFHQIITTQFLTYNKQFWEWMLWMKINRENL